MKEILETIILNMVDNKEAVVVTETLEERKASYVVKIAEEDMGRIIGKQGNMLKKIGSTARFEIEKMLECQVNLKLWVKVKKDWRDSEYLMKNFGYREDE